MVRASCMFAHFFNRIEHCWITKQQLGIPVLWRSDRTKREVCEKAIEAFSASFQHLLQSAGEGPQILSLQRGQTTLTDTPFDFLNSLFDVLKNGLAFVALSRLAHNQNDCSSESATN